MTPSFWIMLPATLTILALVVALVSIGGWVAGRHNRNAIGFTMAAVGMSIYLGFCVGLIGLIRGWWP